MARARAHQQARHMSEPLSSPCCFLRHSIMPVAHGCGSRSRSNDRWHMLPLLSLVLICLFPDSVLCLYVVKPQPLCYSAGVVRPARCGGARAAERAVVRAGVGDGRERRVHAARCNRRSQGILLPLLTTAMQYFTCSARPCRGSLQTTLSTYSATSTFSPSIMHSFPTRLSITHWNCCSTCFAMTGWRASPHPPHQQLGTSWLVSTSWACHKWAAKQHEESQRMS